VDAPATILVVEDEELVREFTVELLIEFGYQVLAAANAREAMRFLESEGLQIDLLFTDIVMPGELDGFALAREARRHRPRLSVVYTSGYTSRTTENGIELFGPLVAKPYRPEQLRTELNRALAGKV
jgi:CheY-like chemotaxis protein